MEDSNQEFIPDFTYKETVGVISTKNSKIYHKDKFTYVSCYNRVNVWDAKNCELITNYGTQKYGISAFNVSDDFIIIGYDNGIIEISNIKQENLIKKDESIIVRPHSRRVTSITRVNDAFISASADGTISLYDLTLENIKVSYKDNNVCADRVHVADEMVYVGCGGKTIKIWKLYNENLFDAIAFDDYIHDFAINGNEALVFMKGGKSCFLDLVTKEKREFNHFKKLRNVVFKNDRLAVQCQKTTYIYDCVKDNSFGLKLVSKESTSENFIQFDLYFDSLIFLTRNNSIQILGAKTESLYHETPILDLQIVDKNIYTFSEEKIGIWFADLENDISDEDMDSEEFNLHSSPYLSYLGQIKLQKSSCFCVFSGYFVVGGSKGLSIYCIKTYAFVKELNIGKVASVCSHNNVLAVCKNSEVEFYNDSFDMINTLTTHDPTLTAKFSYDGSIFCVATIDSKIHVYDYPELSLKFSLYGHSLPVKSFSLSNNTKLLISCGADKLIKIWGLDMGECKKTIAANPQNIEFVTNEAYIFGDKEIMYYKGFQKLRKFSTFTHSIVKSGNDFFVASSDYGLSFYKMNKFEFTQEESSDEIHPLTKTVCNVDEYDMFLQHLEKIENDAKSENISQFYQFLQNTDFNELVKYLYVLDQSSIYIILSVIEAELENNVIINSRLFLQLFKFHKDVCLSFPSFISLKNSLLQKVKELRNIAGINEACVAMDLHNEDVEYEIN